METPIDVQYAIVTRRADQPLASCWLADTVITTDKYGGQMSYQDVWDHFAYFIQTLTDGYCVDLLRIDIFEYVADGYSDTPKRSTRTVMATANRPTEV